MFGLGGPGYGQALAAGTNAATTGAGYGSDASAINSQLLPFLTRQLNSPQGFTQQQTGSMLNQAEAGAGGSTAGLTTEANLANARNRNSGGMPGALDEMARDKDKAISGVSSGIASKDAMLQQQQKQSAASGLGQMYGQDTSAQLKAMGLIPDDVNAATKAYGTGDWASDLTQLGKGINAGIGDIGSMAQFVSGFMPTGGNGGMNLSRSGPNQYGDMID